MRIGINLLFMVPGEVGGSEPLLTNLVKAMLPSDNEFVIFGVRGFGDSYPDIAEGAEIVEVPWSSGAQGLRIAAENSWLARAGRRRRLDVIHHGVGTTPFLKTLPSVVTIHDIQYRHYPENFVRLKRAWLKLNVPYSASRCEVVCVPSNWVKRDVIDAFGLEKGKVVVVPFGSEGLFGESPARADEVRRHYRLDRPYFFLPGRTYPHKNHRFLIDAYSPLSGDADLVLTGPPWFRDAEITAVVRHMSLDGRVRHLGLVPRGHLAGLYEGAISLVYPTRFEGFGANALEAMTARCPVIASRVAALPEVVGEAGILLDPRDSQAWTETMARMAKDSSLRDDLVERGLRRAAEFSWAKAASRQLAAYEQAVGA